MLCCYEILLYNNEQNQDSLLTDNYRYLVLNIETNFLVNTNFSSIIDIICIRYRDSQIDIICAQY